MERRITLPITREAARTIKSGEACLLSGVIYTARDAAHKRLVELAEKGEPLPFEIKDATIYYVGPTPAKPGAVIGSAGPTTSYRMDAYTPQLLKLGLNCMIGKGRRSDAVRQAMQEYGAVYLGAVGGAAALIARSIKSAEVLAYEDLGTEAIHRFTVESFPAIVLMDAHGGNLYESGPAQYREE